MVRTFLQRLVKKWFGVGAAPKVGRVRTARLNIEALEVREVLSGNTAGYLLNPNGNLYQQSSSGVLLRDTGVRDFTAPGGVLYDLHTNGSVYQFANGVKSPTPLFTNASALVSDAASDAFALTWDGHIYEHTPSSTAWSPANASCSSLVSDATGNVFALGWNGNILEHTLGGTAWTTVGDHTARLLSDATGNVFALTYDGTVYEHILGGGYSWNTVDSSISSLVSDATGNVFALGWNGNVQEHTLGGTAWTQVGSTANSLVSDATGNVFALYSNGNVWEHTQGTGWSWTQVGSPASSLVSDATGNVFVLYTNGIVWEHTQGTGWSWTQVGDHTAQLVSDATGNVFGLTYDGTIYEHIQGGAYSWNTVGNPAKNLVSDATGNVFALYTNGIVWEHTQGTGWSWIQVGSNVTSLGRDARGNVFALTSSGILDEHIQGGANSWNTVATNVQSFAVSNTGLVYLTALSTTTGYAPGYSAQYLQTGSAVTLHGAGFGPGTQVQFGSSGSLATPSAIDPNGSWMTVNVPRYAVSGPLTIILADGTKLSSVQTFTVHDYLNTYGFNFSNFPFNVTWDMVKGEFGGNQTDVTLFGLDTGVPSPAALVYWGIVAKILNGNGACFGMALTSDKLAASGQTVYNLPQTAALTTTIEQNHLAQTSAEMIHYFATWALSNHSAQGIYNQLATLLASGDHPLITLGNGINHAVVAYDLEPGPKGNGDYYIDIYDSNRPADPTNDSAQAMASRIYIDPANGWSFEGSTFCNNYGATSLMVVPSSVVSGNLTMPASLSGLATIIFGAPATTAGTALVSAPPSSQPLQGVQQSSHLGFAAHLQQSPGQAAESQRDAIWAVDLAQTGQGKHAGQTAGDPADLIWLESEQLLRPRG